LKTLPAMNFVSSHSLNFAVLQFVLHFEQNSPKISRQKQLFQEEALRQEELNEAFPAH
jgi:hypothetical protein